MFSSTVGLLPELLVLTRLVVEPPQLTKLAAAARLASRKVRRGIPPRRRKSFFGPEKPKPGMAKAPLGFPFVSMLMLVSTCVPISGSPLRGFAKSLPGIRLACGQLPVPAHAPTPLRDARVLPTILLAPSIRMYKLRGREERMEGGWKILAENPAHFAFRSA